MKQRLIFQSSEEQNQSDYEIVEEKKDKYEKTNNFQLTQEVKNNINKRLPRGFCLIKKQDYDRLGNARAPHLTQIIYQPTKIQRQIDLNNPIIKTIDQAWSKRQEQVKKGARFSFQFSLEGRSRQSQKIKNIIQRFRKLIKNTQVQSYLNKVGLMMGLNQIQTQNKKGMLTIDTFKARYMLILQTARHTTFQTQVINQIDEMIQEFLCYVQQARKAQFQNNIQSIQKSIDKITRYLSQAGDGKAQGNWYIRKKKKSQRSDNFNQRQALYFSDLLRKLPTAYLAGIWEIINQRPFSQAYGGLQKYNMSNLNPKKIKEIEFYVKNKLSQIYRSRSRKKQKIQAKRAEKRIIQQQQNNKPRDMLSNQQLEQERNPLFEQLNKIFDGQQFGSFKNQPDVKKQPDQNLQQVPSSLKQKQKNESQIIQKDKLQFNLKNIQNSNNQNNSSDSSIITDQDDSDF